MVIDSEISCSEFAGWRRGHRVGRAVVDVEVDEDGDYNHREG